MRSGPILGTRGVYLAAGRVFRPPGSVVRLRYCGTWSDGARMRSPATSMWSTRDTRGGPPRFFWMGQTEGTGRS